MVCDQGSTNTTDIIDLHISDERPYVIDENGQKVYFLYDMCHLIKSLINNLIKNDYVINRNVISWEPIKELRNYERDKTARFCTKLRDVHINPNYLEKMKVK